MISKPIISKVNCDESPSTCERFEVWSYPTILFIQKGTTYIYKGPRTSKDFIEFLDGGFKEGFDKKPVPKELGSFDYYLKMAKLAMVEIFDAFNPIFSYFGI